jgi:hypothetical protein
VNLAPWSLGVRHYSTPDFWEAGTWRAPEHAHSISFGEKYSETPIFLKQTLNVTSSNFIIMHISLDKTNMLGRRGMTKYANIKRRHRDHVQHSLHHLFHSLFSF